MRSHRIRRAVACALGSGVDLGVVAVKSLFPGIAATLLVAGCGGLAISNSGDAGTDGGRPDGSTSNVDSGSIHDAAVDRGSGDSDSGELHDAGSLPPSCAPGEPGMTNCGAGGSGSESCCTSLEVTGGTFFRTYTSEADGGPTGEADPANVSGFRLDKYLVTVGRFRQFVKAWNDGSGLKGGAGYEPPAGSGKHTYLNGGLGLANSGADGGYEPGWSAGDDSNIAPTDANLNECNGYNTWTSKAGPQENLPINCVNWYESYAFCIWDGGFLPSEAEWEYAAAGGSEQREYPWGSMSPVGYASSGAGLWGQFDLAGEMWEWNLDWYAPYTSPCTNCADTTATLYRAVRGDAFNYVSPTYLLPTYRGFSPPTNRTSDYFTGFRCARTP
jgi:formylglycine-generating enzyme required for sulfatase activity